MYIRVNDVNILIEFRPDIFVQVDGPDDHYYVLVEEYRKNESKPVYVESYSISKKNSISKQNFFKLPIEFYFDFEVSVFKFIDGIGVKRIFTHRFNDSDKLVLFNLNTENYEECKLWIERIKLYQKIHECNVRVESNFDDLNKQFPAYFQTYNIDYYKIYNIGRFPKSSTDYRTRDDRKQGIIWFGNWKTFWSYQHPRPWNSLNSQEIVDDILGLQNF